MEYTNDFIKKLFETSKNQNEVLRKLGRKFNGAGDRLVKKLAKQIDLDLTKYGRNASDLTREKYAENPKHCKCCGKELTYEQRRNDYCSHSCSATINNKGVVRNGGKYETKEHKCLNCGKELIYKQRHNKFCSQQCLNDYRYKNTIQKVLNGENLIRGASGIPKYLKKYLMELHNNKCEKCGWGEEHPITHNIPLEVHHIDGDCTNNKLENLQLLCPNCHCLTENFGSLNKNSKRFHRGKIKLTE